MFTGPFDDEEEDVPYESEKDRWNRENNTGMSAGTCSICGSKIYQSTYADTCMCGENDNSY